MPGQAQPRLSLLDKLLTNNGFGSLGKALRDSVLNAFGSRDDTPQDVFTVFEYRHVHRHDWSKLKSAVIQRWRKVTAKVFPATTPQSTGIEEDDPKEDEHIQEERPSWEPEPELKLRTYPYMIFPLALHKLMWDYLIIALVAYNVLELPMTIAFGSEACDAQALAEEAGLSPPSGEVVKDHCQVRSGGFATFMDIMFWIDIVLTFRTGVIDNRQVIHMQPRFAALHYIRSWLLVDVVSSFPFDTLVYATSTQSASATFLLARLFKLPRLMRTARILKNFRHLSKTTLFQIIYMLFCTFTLTHWAGCGFYFLARWQIKYVGANEFTGGLTWAQVPVSAIEPAEGFVSADFKTKYAAALYWATTTMSTTGYGDILPMTNWERSYALCVMLVGVVLSALVFGVLAQIITEAFDHLPTGAQHQNEVKSKLQAFIEDMKLDSHLTRKLQEALQLHFHLHGGVCLSQLLSTAEVSRNIREDVLMYAHGNRLQVCRMFQGCSIGWFRTFVQYLEPAVALEGEAVFAEKDLPTHLSFVQSGTVKLHLGLQPPKDSSGAPSLQVVPPEALGEYAVVQSKPHEYTSTAETDCEVLSILHSDLVRLLQIFKQDAVTITHTVTAEHKRIIRSISGDRIQGREPGHHVGISEDDIHAQRQGTAHHRSTKGIAWEDRRPDLGQQIGAMRAASSTGAAGRKVRVSQGLSRCDSTHVDEDFAQLLDTLEELSQAQAAMCSKLVKFAASHT